MLNSSVLSSPDEGGNRDALRDARSQAGRLPTREHSLDSPVAASANPLARSAYNLAAQATLSSDALSTARMAVMVAAPSEASSSHSGPNSRRIWTSRSSSSASSSPT